MNRFFTATAWTLALGAGAALAGPLNKAWVAAEAKWVVHIDVEAAMASTMGKCIAAHQGDLDIKPVKEFKKQTGLDAFKDIKGITMYGLSSEADQGVAVVVGTSKLEEAVSQLASEEKTIQKLVDGGRTIYQWHEHGSEKFGFLKRGQNEGDRILVVSGSKAELDSALAVMDGGVSLAGAHEGAMGTRPRSGSLLFVAMRDLDAAGAPHGLKVLRSAKELSADVGEDAEGVYGEVHLKAGNAQDVKTIQGYVSGMLAIARMGIQDEPDMAEAGKVLDGITVEAKDLEFSARVRIGKDLLGAIVDQVNAGKGPLKGPAKPVNNHEAPNR